MPLNGKFGGPLGTVMKWITGGTAAGIALYALQTLGGEGLADVLKSWGPSFGLGTVGIGAFAMVLHVNLRHGIAAVKDGAGAMHEMADANRGLTNAVNQLVERDDSQARATSAAIGFVAQQNEQILARLAQMEQKLT